MASATRCAGVKSSPPSLKNMEESKHNERLSDARVSSMPTSMKFDGLRRKWELPTKGAWTSISLRFARQRFRHDVLMPGSTRRCLKSTKPIA